MSRELRLRAMNKQAVISMVMRKSLVAIDCDGRENGNQPEALFQYISDGNIVRIVFKAIQGE